MLLNFINFLSNILLLCVVLLEEFSEKIPGKIFKLERWTLICELSDLTWQCNIALSATEIPH